MARFSQRSRRGSSRPHAGATPVAPAKPETPTWTSPETGECGDPQTQSFLVPSVTLPAGAATIDLYSDSGVNPPTTLRVAGATPGVGWLSYCESPGNTRTGMVRAWDATHTLFTDSDVAEQAL